MVFWVAGLRAYLCLGGVGEGKSGLTQRVVQANQGDHRHICNLEYARAFSPP